MTTVLIVGAGPSGLTAAIELKRRGIQCRIIDKKLEATQTSNAVAIHSRSLEMWANQGIIDQAKPLAKVIDGVSIYNEAGEKLVDLNFNDYANSEFPKSFCIPQSQSEALLIERLQGLGLTIERGITLSHFKESDSHIECILEHENGQKETVKTEWLLAADGYHSTVRETLNIDYRGEDLKQEFIMIDAPLESEKPDSAINIFYHHNGVVGTFPMQKSCRIIAEVSKDDSFDRNATLERGTFDHLLSSRWPFQFKLGEALWISHFFIHERLADHYRHGRIFLIGDAAHVHSPAGGQGMNTGMQDAFNLGWKLSLVIQGKLKRDLLDTYEAERRPVAKAVLSQSTLMTKSAIFRSSFTRGVRNFLMKHVASMKAFQKHFAAFISETSIQYAKSPLSQHGGERSLLLHYDTAFVLYVSNDCIEKSDIEALAKPHAEWIHIDNIHDNASLEKLNIKEGFCLVRPDMYIACRGKTQHELTEWLEKWIV